MRTAVQPRNVVRTVDVTRPADANIYAAGDVYGPAVGAAIEIPNCARKAGGTGVVLEAELILSTKESTALQCELWLFEAAPTVANDNAVFAPTDSQAKACIGVIPFTTRREASVNCVYRGDLQDLGFRCGIGTRSLYGVLVVRNAYTPNGAEVATIRLKIIQD